jgi:CheY-like chemotaxis protein
MVDILEKGGFDVLELPSAIGATRMLMRNEVAGVIADVSMPGLSGDKLVGVLRRNPRLAHLAVVIVSGTHEDSLKEIQLQQEVDGTLSKRDLSAKLVHTMQRALMNRGVNVNRRAVS